MKDNRNMKALDVIIIGGGGAGLTAALYAGRAQLSTLVFEKLVPGGQIATTEGVENYPGFPEGITGPEISERMDAQARKYGAEIVYREVQSLAPKNGVFEIIAGGEVYAARSVILACGASFRKLGVPGESEFVGRGVSYCATCDGAFFKNKEIVVVGGGDSAIQESLFLTRFVSRLTLIHRRDQLRASPILQERAFKNEKIAFRWDSVVEKIGGGKQVGTVAVKNVKDGRSESVRTDGVFVFIGHDPNTAFLKGVVELDDKGYIVTRNRQETSLTGVFAAGEVRSGSVRQLIAACGEGCAAALAAQEFLDNE